MMDGQISNEAFINNADHSSNSSSNNPLGVLLEAPLGAYRRLKRICKIPGSLKIQDGEI